MQHLLINLIVSIVFINEYDTSSMILLSLLLILEDENPKFSVGKSIPGNKDKLNELLKLSRGEMCSE